jgi:NAD(P)-dependent dehydrogenase (short-subunit alcohol dehydrogenase family)
MDLGLNGKVAVVTGGGQGIGKAIATTLAEEGCRVVVVDINAANAAAVVREIETAGGEAMTSVTDVSRLGDVMAMAKSAAQRFGTIDILVANHAAPRHFGNLWEVDPQVWQQTVNVNLMGTMNCASAVVGYMVAQKSGRIVNIASRAGRVGYPMCPWYSASKAGVIGFSKSLAIDVGRYGITVNAVCPGRTMVERYTALSDDETKKLVDEVPLGKLGRPQDLADSVAFLCSDRAGHITGQTLSVDGGSTRV